LFACATGCSAMVVLTIIGGIIAVLLLAYLIFALLFPERLS
jgi:K+-transporting ATPase KdpF subunit